MISVSTRAATPVVPFFARRISLRLGAIRKQSSSCRDFVIYFILSHTIFCVVTSFADKKGIPSSLFEYVGV